MDIPAPSDPHVFAGSSLDRSANSRRDLDAVEDLKNRDDARLLPYWDLRGLILPEKKPRLAWQPLSVLDDLNSYTVELIFLGCDGGNDDVPCFAIGLNDKANPAKEGALKNLGKFIDARSIAPQLSQPEAAILAHGRSLVDWHARHRYCANCGELTVPGSAGNSRFCPDCDAEHFPRTDPVAIMLVVRDGKCLLGRKREWPPGMYSALAGFIEVGETIEEGVRREVFEEAGIRAGKVRYISSQPWPFPSSLMIGCIAEAETDEISIDDDELEEARWFTRDEIVDGLFRVMELPKSQANIADMPRDGLLRMPNPIAIAHHLARAWLKETE